MKGSKTWRNVQREGWGCLSWHSTFYTLIIKLHMDLDIETFTTKPPQNSHFKKMWVFRASTVSGEKRCGCICISGYYTLSQWTVAMAKVDKIELSFSLPLPPLSCYHTHTPFTAYSFFFPSLSLQDRNHLSSSVSSSCLPADPLTDQTHSFCMFVVQLTPNFSPYLLYLTPSMRTFSITPASTSVG